MYHVTESTDGKNIGLEVTFVPGLTRDIDLSGYHMEIDSYFQVSERIYKVANRNYTIILESI